MARRSTADRAGLTPSAVIDAALALTEAFGLSGWTIRDLAGRLGTSSSAIYHHVGGIEAVHREIARRVIALLPVPEPEPSRAPKSPPVWVTWFERLLLDAYPLLTRYPGLPHWFTMHGPAFPDALPIVETGIGLLRDDGFGERAGTAYALLLNTAMLTLGVTDARARANLGSPGGAKDHSSMLTTFEELPAGAEHARALAVSMIQPYTLGPASAAAERRRYYEAAVRVTIAGVLAERTWLTEAATPAPEPD